MNTVNQIKEGKTSLGIEFGSTRIKAVLVGEDFAPVASGTYDWENRFENGYWTYSEEDITQGLQGCFKSLSDDVRKRYDVQLETTASIGVSAMMHGYLAFDKNDRLLVPFRTWRNTVTEEASALLTEAFNFNIPQRWSVAHLYQAILNKEPHVSEVRFLTTLAGYVHWRLTGTKALGIGDASGMFPVDDGSYNEAMVSKLQGLLSENGFGQSLTEILPEIVPVGRSAGRLTDEGAALLDPSGVFKAGVPFCAPEGDAQTGMVATNSIAKKTGNVSAGTSIFAMAVLEKNMNAVHREIDIVSTPCGSPVAMVHCNNCTADIDAWVRLFGGFLSSVGVDIPKHELYDKLYEMALSGDDDCGGLLSYNYYSGEHVTGLERGMPLLVRNSDSKLNVQNLMRSLIYSSMATLKIGMDILSKQENVRLEKITAHGGLFKSPVTGQRFLAAALDVPVVLTESAGEGGAWGIALLAAYSVRENKEQSLADFLDKKVFAGVSETRMEPLAADVKGFSAYTEKYKAGLIIEKSAVSLS